MAVQILMPALSPTMEEGTLAKWLVKEGDTVQKGEPLIILEAMKMENILKAATEVKIKKVLVEKGKAVEKNTTLIEFE